MSPTPRPIPSITLDKPDPDISTGNDAIDADENSVFKQNYCAQGSEQLAATCAFAPTCNDFDEPCPKGTFCFPQVVCEALANQADEDSSAQEDEVTPAENNAHLDSVTATDLACDDLCLSAIANSDCDYVLSMGIHFEPCTGVPSRVQVGDICIGTGRCGTDLGLNNCPNEQDIYIRLESSMCENQGLDSGSSVIPPISAEVTDNANEDTGGNMQPGDSSGTSSKAQEGNEEATSENLEIGTESWADQVPPTDTDEYETYQEGSDEQNNNELTGWWRQENNLAVSMYDGRKKYSITLFFSIIAFL